MTDAQKLKIAVEAMQKSIDLADDYGDSGLSAPIRKALKAIKLDTQAVDATVPRTEMQRHLDDCTREINRAVQKWADENGLTFEQAIEKVEFTFESEVAPLHLHDTVITDFGL